MIKFFKKLLRILLLIVESIYGILDKYIIMPISRLVYNLFKSTNGVNNINKALNRPQFLIILSLIFSIICFLLIDKKVVNLLENEAEVIKNVPVSVIYNEEAYVVEDVPSTIDIIITGRKNDIYLAKQLGDFKAELDLSKYTKPGTYKAKFKCSEAIGSVNYIIDPSYLSVTIKDRVSEVRSVNYDLLSTDDLDEKLSVDSISLDSTEVVVKGSEDAINKIAAIKALVSLGSSDYKEASTYEMTNIPVIAYNKEGNIVKNVEIVPNTLSGTLVLKSYNKNVPLAVYTTGELLNGKAIASIQVNNSSNFTLDIYGDESEIKNINNVPVTVNVDGMGSETVRNYKVTISKPNGVRSMSEKNVTITVSFGDEQQKTVEVSSINHRNLAEGYSANIISNSKTSVQVKGVQSNINNIEANDINAYVDLSGLTEGVHDVEVKVDNDNPLVNYVATNTIKIQISKS